ncbi:MAG: AI-2E family transporter, partial [Sphaerospermopsis kisseleviana]
LALPLTVVAKIWVQEVLVKDVLDEWKHNHHHDHHVENELVMIAESADIHETEEMEVKSPEE